MEIHANDRARLAGARPGDDAERAGREPTYGITLGRIEVESVDDCFRHVKAYRQRFHLTVQQISSDLSS